MTDPLSDVAGADGAIANLHATDFDDAGAFGERLPGHPIVYNDGEIRLGNDVVLATHGEAVTLVTNPGGSILLCDAVTVGAGTTIAAFGRVEIGRDTRVGARCRLLDDASAAGIHIGERVQIEDDVLIVSGAVIGHGARILRGALVSGNVQQGAVVKAAGDARTFAPSAAHRPDARAAIIDAHAGEAALLHEVRVVVSEILPSAAAADADVQLADWDSLTTVHLIVALEDRFGITIDDGALIDRRTLQALAAYVEEQRVAIGRPVATQRQRPAKATVIAIPEPGQHAEDALPTTAPSPPPLRPSGRRSQGISLEMRALGGAFSKSSLLVKLAGLLPIWSMRHLRARLLRAAGCDISPKSTFLGRVRFIGASPANLEVAEGAIIGPNITLGVDGKITIGHNVSIGPGVTIYTGTHDVGPAQRRMDPRVQAKPVVIDDGAWIGLNALILPGVRIGAGAIVSAGAVVSSDVPANTVVAGNPAVVTRTVVA